jgi:hypothetical protein
MLASFKQPLGTCPTFWSAENLRMKSE